MQTINILILEHSNLSSSSFSWQQTGNYVLTVVVILKVQKFQSLIDNNLNWTV